MSAGPETGTLQLIAVIGCQRSGTTLTGQILGAHPSAVLIDEFDGLYEWFAEFIEAREEASSSFSRLLAQASAKYARPEARFTSGPGQPTRLRAAITHLVLKAPNLTYDWEGLASMRAPVRIVYPVREPRAVVASMARLAHIDFVGNQLRLLESRPAAAAAFPLERRRLADATLSLGARRATIWRVKSDNASRFEARGLPVLQFRYEDLVTSPDATITALARFAGLTTDPAIFDHSPIYVGAGPGGTDRTRPVDQASLGGAATPGDDEVLRYAGPAATRFGYGAARASADA